jgi:hypothetical protein
LIRTAASSIFGTRGLLDVSLRRCGAELVRTARWIGGKTG